MQVESNQLVLKMACGIFVDRQRNCCAAASAAGGRAPKRQGRSHSRLRPGEPTEHGGGGRGGGGGPPASPPAPPAPVWLPGGPPTGTLPPIPPPATTRHEKSPGRSG